MGSLNGFCMPSFKHLHTLVLVNLILECRQFETFPPAFPMLQRLTLQDTIIGFNTKDVIQVSAGDATGFRPPNPQKTFLHVIKSLSHLHTLMLSTAHEYSEKKPEHLNFLSTRIDDTSRWVTIGMYVGQAVQRDFFDVSEINELLECTRLRMLYVYVGDKVEYFQSKRNELPQNLESNAMYILDGRIFSGARCLRIINGRLVYSNHGCLVNRKHWIGGNQDRLWDGADPCLPENWAFCPDDVAIMGRCAGF